MRRGRSIALSIGLLGGLVVTTTSAGAVTGGTAIPAADLAPTARLGWLVRIDTDGQRCTGSLVHAEWVVTAAHCVDGTTVQAFVGDSSTATAVDQVVVDPDHDDTSVAAHDVAALHLATPSTATPALVGLDAGDVPAVGQSVALLGWGDTASGGTDPAVPSEGTAAISGRTTSQVTSATPAVGCDGDSGGPVASGGQVVAVIGGSDASCASFTISSRLSASRSFLEATIPLPDLDPVVQSGTAESHGGQPVTFGFTATSHDGTPLGADAITDLTGDHGGLECVGSAPIECTYAPSQVGNHHLQLTVTDGFGSSVATWDVEVVGVVGVVRLPSPLPTVVVDEEDTDTELELFIATGPGGVVEDVVLDLEGTDATIGTDVEPDEIEASTQELFSLTVVGDDLAEGDERFTITPITDHPFLEPAVTTVTIRDDDDGTIGGRRSIVAESAGLAPGERLRVPYRAATARNQAGHTVGVTCTPRPGTRFAQGTTDATCTSAPGAERAFTVTVQAPTAPGSVTRAGGGAGLTCAVPGNRIRVSAAGFRSRAATSVGFVTANGSVATLGAPRAAGTGRVSTVVTIPTGTQRGDRQLVVTGPGATRDRVRSFDLRIAGRC